MKENDEAMRERRSKYFAAFPRLKLSQDDYRIDDLSCTLCRRGAHKFCDKVVYDEGYRFRRVVHLKEGKQVDHGAVGKEVKIKGFDDIPIRMLFQPGEAYDELVRCQCLLYEHNLDVTEGTCRAWISANWVGGRGDVCGKPAKTVRGMRVRSGTVADQLDSFGPQPDPKDVGYFDQPVCGTHAGVAKRSADQYAQRAANEDDRRERWDERTKANAEAGEWAEKLTELTGLEFARTGDGKMRVEVEPQALYEILK